MVAAAPGPGWAEAIRVATSRNFCASDPFAHCTRQAVGGDDAEPDPGHDGDTGPTSTLVESVEGTEHLELVADVEVMHPDAETCLGQRGCGVEKRAGGIEHQFHVGQCFLECGCVVQVHNSVRQAQACGEGGDLWSVPTGEDGAMTAVKSVLGDQPPRVASGAIEHP